MRFNYFAASLTLACALLTITSASAQGQGKKTFGKGAPFTVDELPVGKLKSQLQTLDPEARGKALKWLHTFNFGEYDATHHLRADAKGGIFYICADHHGHCDGHHHGPVKPGAVPSVEAAAPATEEAPVDQGGTNPEVAGAAVPVSSPPAYNSKPGATRHIYIDFNGALVSGKDWSETDNKGTTDTADDITWNSWDCDAWSSDADKTTFSDAEQADIRRIWERIAEDYAPFDVNVTTDVTYDPATYTGDKNKVGWLLVTATIDKLGARCPHFGAGGVAYVGVYGNSDYFSTYQPAWVTPMGVANTAEAASHEMGHNMGLSHDGLVAPATPATYYGGHNATASAPSWGPIMGTGYGQNVSQWSKGEYYGGSQLQDDLSIINGRTPYRVDDHGGTFGTATVWLDSSINQPGIIERTNDNDVFTFTTGAGTITFNANPYKCDTETWGGNADIVMELYNSSQVLVASSNPASDVKASISYAAAAGDYYLVIKPTGCGTPTVASPSGYTVYGSLGQYTVTGTVIPASSIVLTSPNGGETWVRGSNTDITWASGLGGNVKIELLKAGALFTTIAATTPNDGALTWAVPADFTIGTNYRVRISSVEQPAKTDESLADFSVTVPPPYYASMDTNPGWTLGTGWAYGVPTGANQDGYGNPDPTAGFNGSNVIGYRLDGDYEASITATRWATTPAINCSNHTGCKLSFYRWHGVEGGYDNSYIEVSNNGSTWTQVWRSSTTNGVNDQDSGWTYCEYNISAVADGNSTVYVRWGMGTTDSSWQWCGWNLDEVRVDGTYTGPAVGATIAQSGGSTNVTEGGATDTYTVKLNSPPTANVTVTVVPNPQVSVSPTTLTFTTSNWGTAQTVTVTAVNDTVNEFAHTGSISHTLSSADATYNNLPVEGVVVNITDNDNTAPVVNAGPDQSIALSGSAWSPADAGPLAWYDANDAATITQVGGAVSQWADKAGTSHMVQATGTKQPVTGTTQINGLNSIAFDGTDDALKTAANPFGASISNAMLIGVFNLGTINTGTTLFSLSSSTSARWQSHAPWSDGNMYFDCGGASGANRISGASGFAANQNRLLGYYCSTTDSVQQVWVDGTNTLSDATGHTVTTAGGIALGHDGTSGFDNCRMGEVVVINGTVSAVNRQKLEGYLAHKWGLAGSLPAAHPYKATSPNNLQALASLDGTASDANSDPLTYAWTVVSGPGAVVFGNAAAIDTTATFTVEGTYTLRLTANDSGAQTSDDVVITVGPATTDRAVTYNGNGNTGGSIPVDGNSPYANGSTVTVLGNTGALTRTGYTFNGWNTAANGTGTAYAPGASFTITAATTLYAQWTGNTYTVSFTANGGNAPSQASKSVTMGSTYGTLATISRTGYTFAGWFTAASGGMLVTAATTVTNPSNHELFAQWTANTYTVTFNGNGGGTPSPATTSVTYGATYGPLATVSRAGYSFTGWYTLSSGGVQVTSSTAVAITAAQTLYAQWTVNAYTITFDSAGGSAVAPITQNFGTAVTSPAAPTRAGYTFAGWSPAVPATMPANNLTVTAQWTANTYTVTFEANGGGVPSPASMLVTYNSTYGALATVTRTGYTFNGWFTAASGGILVTSGTTVTLFANHALHAQWTQNFPEMDVTRGGSPEPSGGYDAVSGTSAGAGAPLTYLITNSGAADLTLGSAVVSGQSNCAVVINTTPSSTVTPSGTTNLALTVTPAAVGAWSFNLEIASNDSNENPYQWMVHGVAQASATTSFPVSVDTYINGASAGTSYGSADIIALNVRSNQSRHGLINFDLSTIPAGASVSAANIQFVAGGGQTGSVEIYDALAAWDATATSTSSSGAIGSTLHGSANITTATLGTAVPSITLNAAAITTVQGWINNTVAKNGFSIKTNYTNNSANSVTVCSNDHATVSYRPKLNLTYTYTPQVSEMHVTRTGAVIADAGTDTVSGSVAGTGTPLTYAISNLGNANLTLTTPVSVTGASNCTVLVNAEPANSVVPSTATSLVLTVTPTASGAWSANVSIANNDPDEAPYNWTIGGSATGGSVYSAWAATSSLSGDNAATAANPDGDNLTNLQEFAFGTNPTSPASGPLDYVSNGNVNRPGTPVAQNFAAAGQPLDFHAVFARRKDFATAGLTYTVEFSADLNLWTVDATPPARESAAVTPGDVDAVSVPFPASVPLQAGGTASPKFFRIVVTGN